MSLVKAFGIPTGAPLAGGQFTPPHYGRTDYSHRWAANTQRGKVAHGATVDALPDMAGSATLIKGDSTATLDDDGGANPSVTVAGAAGQTIKMSATTTDGTTHTSFWCVNLTAYLTQAIRTPGRVYGTTATGLTAFGTGVVNTTATVLGWHVIALTSTPSGFSVWVDGVKDGDYTGPAGTQNVWGIQPTGESTVGIAEGVTFASVLTDTDVVAISQAMMRERGL